MNIRAVVADVDGVMVGKRPGVNFPLPHKDVIQALREVHSRGIPIILCTAKFYVGIKQIALQAHLGNPHITDGGALIINLLTGEIVREQVIDNSLVAAFADTCTRHNLYLELYSATDYYIQKDQKIAFTDRRSELLQRGPTLVDSLKDIAQKEQIIKMIFFAEDQDKKQFGHEAVLSLGSRIHFIWSHHPFLDPWMPGVITAADVSKVHAMLELLETLGIKPDDVLGIGDSASDWNFMERCGAAAVVGDKDRALCDLVKTKAADRRYLAGSVDDHGLIEIFRHFKLL